MKILLPLVAGALLVGASLPARADQPVGAMKPEASIPANLPRMATPGPFDDFTKQVQQKLNEQGFDAGPVNGDFGAKTQAALAQYQLANLLPASGMPDDATLRELGIQRPGTAAVTASAPSDGDAAAGSTAPAATNR